VKPTHPTFVLGVLFIIIDDLPHEALWRVWLEQLDNVEECVKIIIHAKFPNKIKSAWVRERLAKSFHLKPNWGSVVLTEVMVKLLEEVKCSIQYYDVYSELIWSCALQRRIHRLIK
jgi:hypothetical protein